MILLDRALTSLRESLLGSECRHVKLVFHGGEPLLAGWRWLTCASALATRILHGAEISHLLHTHGWHPPDDFDSLLASRFGLGVSVELPFAGSTVRIPEIISLSHQKSRLWSVQLVLTTANMHNVEALQALCHSLPAGINLKLIPCMSTRPDKLSLTPSEYAAVLNRFCAVFEESQAWAKMFIEPISWIRIGPGQGISYRGCRFTDECNFKNDRLVTAAIDSDGLVYPCNRFAGVREFAMADIRDRDWLSQAAASIAAMKSQVYDHQAAQRKCVRCVVRRLGMCAGTGGCPFHAMMVHKTGAADLFCLAENMATVQFLQHGAYGCPPDGVIPDLVYEYPRSSDTDASPFVLEER